MGFIFDAQRGETPDTARRRRELADHLWSRIGGAKTVADGVVDLAHGIAAGLARGSAARIEQRGAASAASAFADAMTPAMTPRPEKPAASAYAEPIQSAPLAGPMTSPPQKAQGAAAAPASWLQYDNRSATRNQPLNNKLVTAMGFLPDMGVSMRVFSGGQDAAGPRRTGSHRHDHGNAGDVLFYRDGRQLDWSKPEDVPIYQEIVRRAKSAGVTGFGAGQGYMQRGSMHLGFGTPAVWGAGGAGANAPEWLRQAFNGPGAPASSAQAAIATPAIPATQEQNAPPPQVSVQPASAPPEQQGAQRPQLQWNPFAPHIMPDQISYPGMPLNDMQKGHQPGWKRQQIEQQGGRAMPGQAMSQSSPQQPAPRYLPLPPQPPAPPDPLSQTGRIGLLQRILTHPFSTDEQRSTATMLMKQLIEQNDPQRQLDMEYKRAQIENLKRTDQPQRRTQVVDIGGRRILTDMDSGGTIKDLGPSPVRQDDAPSGYRRTENGNLERIPGFRDTNLEMDMRKEFDGLTKDFRSVRDSYNRIQASAENPSPAGDLSMIFNYMRMLDPGSVVRESEFATAATAAPLLQRLGIDWNKVQSVWAGEKMTPEMRADFLSRAQKLYEEQDQTFQSLADQYSGMAARNGLDPSNIILTPRVNPRKGSPIPEGAVPAKPTMRLKLDATGKVIP